MLSSSIQQQQQHFFSFYVHKANNGIRAKKTTCLLGHLCNRTTSTFGPYLSSLQHIVQCKLNLLIGPLTIFQKFRNASYRHFLIRRLLLMVLLRCPGAPKKKTKGHAAAELKELRVRGEEPSVLYLKLMLNLTDKFLNLISFIPPSKQAKLFAVLLFDSFCTREL